MVQISNFQILLWKYVESLMNWNKLNSSLNNFSPLRAALKHSFSSNEYIHYILWSLQYIVHTSMYVNVMMMSWNKTCSISFIFYHQAAIFITLMKLEIYRQFLEMRYISAGISRCFILIFPSPPLDSPSTG